MRRTLITGVVLFAIGCSATAFAQSKEAREKHEKAMKIVDTRRGDPLKAEKFLKEAIAASPEWLQPYRDLADLYSLLRRFQDASDTYAKAVALDDQQKKLSREDRNSLLDALGVSQAQSRQFDHAVETYKKAIKEDDSYAFFHYNLACTYAEKGDLDKALPELRRSWELRENRPEGTRFPDPRQDSSFKDYLDDKRFQKAVEDIVL